MLRTTIVLMSAQALLAWLFYLARQRSNRPRSEWGAAGLLFLIFCLMSLPLILQYAMLWSFKSLALKRNLSSGKYLAYSLALSVVILLPFGLHGVWRSAERRQRYPVQSLAARLDYETSPPARSLSASFSHNLRAAGEPDSTLAEPQLVIDVDELFEDSAAANAGRRRAQLLQALHESYLHDFVGSPGFGVGRMSHRRDWRLAARRDNPPQQPAQADAPLSAAASQLPGRAPTDESLTQLLPVHRTALVDFANPEGFGWIQDRRRVAGFQPHAFSLLPSPSGNGNHPPAWKTQRIELVSLLKHQQPMVYVSDHLPNMEELMNPSVPVRALDAFERRALSALQHERRDLVGETTGNKLRMLGSIRAAKQCLQCHSVSHGDLLGAFSYELLDQTKPKQESQEAAPETF